MAAYQEQRRTIVNHQQELRIYLEVRRFGLVKQSLTYLRRIFLMKPAVWNKQASS